MRKSSVKRTFRIDAALARIDAGTFGICAKCGQPIAERRLGTVPHTPLCQACAGEA